MINLASIRTAAAATPGNVIAMEKEQLEQLLHEAELGQTARRELRMLSAIGTMLPTSIEGLSA
ncbi:hypothetical protein [uncultured Sphingomonas sp.]|uniref:hypothetical protein n=1 Tax=uncultured Sphingomonas sp. TaxID=158754 RepID=UPI0025FA322B|nr:hypothetical protein [uncultured Sphingomonas sp.]